MDDIGRYTWGLVVYNELFNLLSCVSMALNILNIALIKNCFLGGRLRFGNKAIYRAFSIVPLFFAYFLVGVVVTLISNDWDFGRIIEVDYSGTDIWAYVVRIFIFAVCMFTCFQLYEKHRILHTIAYFLSIILIEFYIQGIILYTMAYFSDDKVAVVQSLTYLRPGDSTVYAYLICYFVIIFVLFLILYYGYYKRHKSIYISWGYRIVFFVWIIIIGFMPIIPIAQETEADMYRLMGYGIGIMIPLLILGVPFFIIAIVTRRSAVEKTEIQEEYITSELEYINQYKKSQSETRAFRHDMVNNLSLLSMLMENGKSAEAKEHLETLLGSIKSLSPKYSTGDEMLDCIVSMKASVMEEHGIEFFLEGVADGGLNLEPVEICSLFANALDNAIDACNKVPEADKRKIGMYIRRTDSFYNIKIENTFIPNGVKIDERLLEDGEYFTTKENKNLHGYGIRNMKNIVTKYEGMIKAEVKDNIFILRIMIPR